MNTKTWTAAERRAFAALLGLAAVLRFYTLGSQPFWSDEYFSLRCISQPSLFQDILHTLVADIYPPLYYLFTWAVTRGSQSEFFLRFWSAIGSVACVGMVYVIARRNFGFAAGLTAGLLACVSPMGIYYAQEFKLYSFFAAINLWVLYEFLALSEDASRGWKRLALATAASMYAYYLSPYLLFPLFIFAGARCLRGEAAARLALKGMLLGMLAALPLLPFFLKSILVFQGPDYLLDAPILPWYTAQNFSLGFWAAPALAELAAGLFIAVILLNGRREAAAWRLLGPLLAFALLPTLVNWLISMSLKPNYSDRALLASAYAWVLAAGVGIVVLRPWPRALALVLILGLSVPPLFSYYTQGTRYNFRPAYEALKAQAAPGDAVFHNCTQSLYPFKYYSRLDPQGLPQWWEMEEPGFVAGQAASGMRRYWRPVNEWLKLRGLGINAGAEESWVWGERLDSEALKGVRRVWVVDASPEIQAVAWKPWLHLARNHFIAPGQLPYDLSKAGWLLKRGFKNKGAIDLAAGMKAWRFEKAAKK